MYSSEVTPSVWTSTRSTSRPMPKPMIAPGHRAAQQPDRHHDQRREVGADAEDRDLRDRRLLDHDRDEQRAATEAQRGGRRSPSLTAAAPRRGAGVRAWSGSARRRGGAGRRPAETWTWPLLSSLFWLAFDDRADRDPRRIQRLERDRRVLKPAVTTAGRRRPGSAARAAAGPGAAAGSGCRPPATSSPVSPASSCDLRGDGERVVGDQRHDRDGRSRPS